jgi:F0F1-type ATP synthase membrane subunit b/b'
MAPQPRGVVPSKHLARIQAARDELADAQEQFEQAVANAFNAGASIRELAKATGLSCTTVQKYADSANGA